jgi:hypothetical protein
MVASGGAQLAADGRQGGARCGVPVAATVGGVEAAGVLAARGGRRVAATIGGTGGCRRVGGAGWEAGWRRPGY